MTAATEMLALRTYLLEAIDPQDWGSLAIHAIGKASQPAIAKGWTGREVAAHGVAGIYDGTVRNLSGYIIAAIQELADTYPPREVTPTPPPLGQVLEDMHRGNRPVDSASASEWANVIRATVKR